MDSAPKPEPPRVGDVLFPNDPKAAHHVRLQTWSPGDREPYADGYLFAANNLIHRAASSGDRDKAALAVPAVFLYRHHVELVMKTLIIRLSFVLGRELSTATKRALRRHHLGHLWDKLEPLMKETWLGVVGHDPDDQDFRGVEHIIDQFEAFDPDSTRFRYPTSQQGQPSLPTTMTGFNVGRFAEVIERVAYFLQTFDDKSYYVLGPMTPEMEQSWVREIQEFERSQRTPNNT